MTGPTAQRDLIAAAQRIFPGGVLSRHKLDAAHQLVFVSGRGAHVTDAAGREFIDFTCAGGALLLGYDDPGVLAALDAQARRGIHFLSLLNDTAIGYGTELVEVLPIGGQIRFCCSGAEATFNAIRLARAYTGRNKILKFEGAYHGHHDYGMWSYNRFTGDAFSPVPNSAGMAAGIAADMLTAPFNDAAAAEEVFRREKSEIAAIIAEPVQRMTAPRPGYLQRLRELASENGAVLIFDETVTGFRLALGGAQERFGVLPDLAVYGKSLGGGLPLAAVVGDPEIMALASVEAWQSDPRGVFFSGTLFGNPMACAAGRALLHALRSPDAYPPFLARAEALKTGLARILDKHGVDAHIVGEGPMWRLHFGDPGRIHDVRATSDKERQRAFDLGLLDSGIFVRPGGGHYFSMAHTDEDVETTLRTADRIAVRL